MTIRAYSNSNSPSYSYDLLPEEILLKCLSYIDVLDTLIIDRVCTTWNRVASDETIWIRIACERKINMKLEAPSTKAKVLLSSAPYCKQARKLFYRELEAIPTNLKPEHERALIDNTLKGLRLPKSNPSKPLSYKSNSSKMIEENIPFTQVLLYWKTHHPDAIFDTVIKSINQPYVINQLFDISIRKNKLFHPHESYNNILISKIDSDLHELSIIPEYLSNHTEHPPFDSMHLLCRGYAFASWMKDLEKINTDRYINMSSYQNDQAIADLEKILREQDYLPIQFPAYIHTLIKKMASDAFLDLSTTHLVPSYENKFIDNILECMTESYHKALASIRKTKSDKKDV